MQSISENMVNNEYMVMRFSILENAIDELSFAATNLDGFLDCLCEEIRNAKDGILPGTVFSKNTRDGLLKGAVCHLFSGCELMLKTSLYYKERDLILWDKDVRKISDMQFEYGDFKSIDFCEATKRVKNEFELDYTKGSINSVHIFRLKALRNKIEHFAITMHINTIIWLLFSAWQEISAFSEIAIVQFLNQESQREKYNELCESFLHAIDFYKQLVSEAKEQNIFDFQIEI